MLNFLSEINSDKIPTPLLLSHEKNLESIGDKRLNNRYMIIQKLQEMNSNWLGKLRHFQPQTGCFNKCGFCSQYASGSVYELSLESIEDIISAIKTIAVQQAIDTKRIDSTAVNIYGQLSNHFVMPDKGLVGYNTTSHSGIIYLYLDNDPSFYPYLDKLIELLYNDLGVKSRISTVGFSGQNSHITEMYKRICGPLSHAVSGIRLSLSDYGYGFKDSKYTKQEQFAADLTHNLSIFKKQLLSTRNGRKGFCVELRYSPLVYSCELNQCVIDNHHVLQCGEYLIISKNKEKLPPIAKLKDPNNHRLNLDQPGISAWQFLLMPNEKQNWYSIAQSIIDGSFQLDQFKVKHSILHRLENEDGVYYGIDVERCHNGYCHARYFFPKTIKRPGSGYINGERYLLNEILRIKAHRNNFNWSDVDEIIDRLVVIKEETRETQPLLSSYIELKILPLTTIYTEV